jgi:tetratricopeptide (TPR) repeat protein
MHDAFNFNFTLWKVCLVIFAVGYFIITMSNFFGYSGFDDGTLGILRLIAGIAIIVGVVFFQYLLLYRCWKLVPVDIARTTPRKAIIGLCIPLWQAYWMFVAYSGLGKDMNETLRQRGTPYQVNEVLGSTYCWLWLIHALACAASQRMHASYTSTYAFYGDMVLLINCFVLFSFIQSVKDGAIALLTEPCVPPKWLPKVAEMGDAEAQFELGSFYHRVPKDYVEAIRWLRLSAEQDNAGGQCLLGKCHFEGEGVPQTVEEAVRLFRLSAEQGYAEAQYQLGKCYSNGQGVSRDKAEALRWFQQAADQGHENARGANWQHLSLSGAIQRK